jgi:uncharacterized OB-fold protein/acyl dehydratase
VHDRLMVLAEELAAEGERPAPPCPDPVNAAMIRNWTQALGDRSPLWARFAPPAMIQVWSMQAPEERAESVADRPLAILDEAGYTGVVATNCEQTYDRYLRLGERLHSTVRFGGVAGPKRTALGEGYFVTWYQTWYSGDDRVAEMLFRVLKFRPRTAHDGADSARTGGRTGPAERENPAEHPGGSGESSGSGGRYPLRPAVGPDTAFFWEGADAGELRIQRCAECGRLRHPPGPMCPRCHSTKRDHVTARGRGVVHSHVVHHHPPVPGLRPPFVVALVELEEGVRMVGNVLGCPPQQVHIGMPVELFFQRMDDELTLPQWRPAGADTSRTDAAGAETARAEAAGADTADAYTVGGDAAAGDRAGVPAELRVELTPTFVIATAIATRDFTPVHHDPALARAQGAKDIFLNILTTMGLVQRYVLERLPDATLAGISVRLGTPAYAGDTLTITGRVAGDVVEVRGAVSGGDHVVATVRLAGNAVPGLAGGEAGTR